MDEMKKETYDINYYDVIKLLKRLGEIFKKDEYHTELKRGVCIVTSIRKLSEEEKESVMKFATK